MRYENQIKIFNSTVIAGEIGINLNYVPPEVPLGSLGIDSLMGLATTTSIREKIGIDVPSDLLANNPSISALEKKLNTSFQ